MESGLVELWTLSTTVDKNGATVAQNAALAVRFDPFICHVSAVHRLRWKYAKKREDCTNVQLASCGADHCVRIFQVHV